MVFLPEIQNLIEAPLLSNGEKTATCYLQDISLGLGCIPHYSDAYPGDIPELEKDFPKTVLHIAGGGPQDESDQDMSVAWSTEA